jgi:hypothetical protein
MYAVMTDNNPNFLNNIIFSESQFLLEWIWYVVSPQLKVLSAGKSSLDSRVPHSTQRQIKRMGGNHRTAFCRTLLFEENVLHISIFVLEVSDSSGNCLSQ